MALNQASLSEILHDPLLFPQWQALFCANEHAACGMFAPLAPASPMRPVGNLNRFSFSLVTRRFNDRTDAGRTSEKP